MDVSTVTANFFPTVGIDPLHGRHFTAEEEAAGGPAVVILSHRLWTSRYGGDPAIVGRRIRLDGLDQTVVGVLPATGRLWLPAEAFLVTDAQIWKPLQFNYANQPPRNFTFFTVFGRMKPGVTAGAGAVGPGNRGRPAARRTCGPRVGRHADPRRGAAGRMSSSTCVRR